MLARAEENNEGPSVDSTDPEERIAARRARIKRRIEMAKRAAAGISEEETDIVKEIRVSDEQMDKSRLILQKLVDDGNTLISNIRVASDSRENQRRLQEANNLRLRRDKIEAEEKTCGEKLEEISRKWDFALMSDIPQELNQMLIEQEKACGNVIEEKHKLADEFKAELNALEEAYVTNLKQMVEDIDLLVERMEEQTKTMTLSYKNEMLQTEKTFEAERANLISSETDAWEKAAEHRRSLEENFMEKRATLIDFYENELDKLRTQHAEEYIEVKIKLESQAQLLEQQLQQMKATYQLNQEKLDYNYQVLKKRREENRHTENEQKKKITRQNDVLNKLKLKFQKQQKQTDEEITQVTSDYERISDLLNQLVKKSQHFLQSDGEKFQSVWLMNEDECKKYLQRINDINRIIMQQQLGHPYTPPEAEFTKNIGPLKRGSSASVDERSAAEVLREVMGSGGNAAAAADSGAGNVVGGGDANNANAAEASPLGSPNSAEDIASARGVSVCTVKSILNLICTEAGFLLEDKLRRLVKSLPEADSDLMKMDAIFASLGVESETDVRQLVAFFADYKHRLSQNSDPTLAERRAGVHHPTEDEEDEGVCETIADDPPGEFLSPDEVVKCLREFVEDNNASGGGGEGAHAATKPTNRDLNAGDSQQLRLSANLQRDNASDAAYWAKYRDYVDEKQENLWDALIESFEKYHDALTARSTLINENEAMQQQNTELRALLQQYLTSNVNKDLVIPPTKLLPNN